MAGLYVLWELTDVEWMAQNDLGFLDIRVSFAGLEW